MRTFNEWFDSWFVERNTGIYAFLLFVVVALVWAVVGGN